MKTTTNKELEGWKADLIVDAMIGSQQSQTEEEDQDEEDKVANETLREMIQWASQQSAPILSIDFPSAMHGPDGMSFFLFICERRTPTHTSALF